MPSVDHPLLIAYRRHLEIERAMSPHTVRAYLGDASGLLEGLEALRVEPTEANRKHLRIHLGELARKLAASSRARRTAGIRSFFRFLEDEGLVDPNPALRLRSPKVPKKLPRPLPVAEVNALLDQAFEEGPLGKRDRAFLELLYATGVRVSELCGLSLDDVDLPGRTIRVMGKGGKERICPFHEAAAATLDRWLTHRGELLAKPRASQDPTALFLNRNGGRLTARSVARSLEKRLKTAGVLRKAGPHALRHSFASHLLVGDDERPALDIRSIQELLGHASLASTQRYTEVGWEHLARVYDSAHPRA